MCIIEHNELEKLEEHEDTWMVEISKGSEPPENMEDVFANGDPSKLKISVWPKDKEGRKNLKKEIKNYQSNIVLFKS